MNIIGEKVTLRAIELSDAPKLLEIINDEVIESLIGGWSFPVSSLNQEEWIRNQKPSQQILRCMIDDKLNHKTLGTVILSDIDYKNGTGELHIKLLKDGRGKGYGVDTINTIVRYAFDELRLNCIYGRIISYNTISQAMVEKCGFFKEGILRKRIFKGGKYYDLIEMSILKEDIYGDRQ